MGWIGYGPLRLSEQAKLASHMRHEPMHTNQGERDMDKLKCELDELLFSMA